MIVSNEAFSFVRADEHTKASMRSLEDKWDVRVILAYRPLETWYTSLYYEDRAQTIFSKKDEDFRNWFPADGWNAPMYIGSSPIGLDRILFKHMRLIAISSARKRFKL